MSCTHLLRELIRASQQKVKKIISAAKWSLAWYARSKNKLVGRLLIHSVRTMRLQDSRGVGTHGPIAPPKFCQSRNKGKNRTNMVILWLAHQNYLHSDGPADKKKEQQGSNAAATRQAAQIPARPRLARPRLARPCRQQRRGVDQQNMSAYCECAADRRVVLPKTGEAFNIGIRSISFPHYHSRSWLLAHKLPSHISLLRYFIQTRSNRIGKY